MRLAPRYPNVYVRTRDIDSAIGLMERVAYFMREHGINEREINSFRFRATNSTQRGELIDVVNEWVATDERKEK